MSKDECLYGDWHTIGYDDGAAGHSRVRIGEHQKSCTEYGVTPDFTAYQSGYDQGVRLFCTQQNGYNRGLAGYSYTGNCPEELEQNFVTGYRLGKEIYGVKKDREGLVEEQSDIDRLLDTVSSDIQEMKSKLFSDTTAEQDRKKLYQEIEFLREERSALELRHELLSRDIEELDLHLQYLESSAATRH